MKKMMLLLAFVGLISMQMFAQKTISGVVKGADDGLPLPGVSVMVKGTTLGIMTDFDGKYSLAGVPDDAATLTFSFMGYETKNVAIKGRTTINVSLATAAQDIDEVVVTAVGISRSQKALGYSVSTVNADKELKKSEPDVLRSLQGKVAGVDIKGSSGAAGSATRITIRGNSSFFGNNQPLIVVDGVPYSNDQISSTSQTSGGGAYGSGMADLDPNDIETINVLKGAAAAALYGSRASNGVIIITTKSGNAKVSTKGLEVNFTSSVSFEKIANLPDYQNTYGNGADFVYANANGSWGPRFDSMDSIPTWPAYAAAFPDLLGEKVPYEAQPDNVSSLFETGLVLENSVNIRGGSKNRSFSITASNLDQAGYIPNSGFKRSNLSLGGASKLNNGLNVSGSFSYSRTNQFGSLYGNNQVEGASSSFARTLWLGRTWDMSLPYTDPVTGGPVSTSPSQYDNPLWAFENNTAETTTDRMSGSIALGYELTDWLSAEYQFGLNSYSLKRLEITDINSRGAGGLGAMVDDYAYNQELESNLILTAKKDITPDLNLVAIVGQNVNQRYFVRDAFSGTEIITRGIDNLDNTVSVEAINNYYTKRRLVALYTDVSLGYKDFLYLNFTGRNDWSSTLPKESNSYFYPHVSGSFVFSELIPAEFLSIGKARLGWAKVGNDASPYYTSTVFPLGDPFSGMPTAYKSSVGVDPELSPEFTTELEAGLQLGFLNNRINVDFTWYDRHTTDQIAPISLPRASGYTQYYTNFGELQNKGIELGFELIPLQMDNSLRWSIYTTFTRNRNEVLKLDEGGELERLFVGDIFDDIKTALEVGKPYGFLYGSYYLRDDEGNFLINPSDGLPIYAVGNKDIGDPNPDFNLGVNNTLSFKGMSLTVVFDWKQGGDFYSNSITSMLGRGVTKDTEDREGAFLIPGYLGDPNTLEPILDAEGNKIPNNVLVSGNDLYFSSGGASGSFAINSQSEMQVYDGTVFRLREVSFGYDLPHKLIEKTPFGGISLSFVGRNLWYFAPNVPTYTNFDPELNSYGSSNIQGIEWSAAPSVKRYGFSVKLTF